MKQIHSFRTLFFFFLERSYHFWIKELTLKTKSFYSMTPEQHKPTDILNNVAQEQCHKNKQKQKHHITPTNSSTRTLKSTLELILDVMNLHKQTLIHSPYPVQLSMNQGEEHILGNYMDERMMDTAINKILMQPTNDCFLLNVCLCHNMLNTEHCVD